MIPELLEIVLCYPYDNLNCRDVSKACELTRRTSYSPSTNRLLVTANTLGTPLARRPIRFLSA